jgi:hypothetical protein
LDEGRIQIETWLDNLAQYAETVVDGDSIDEDDTPSPTKIGESRENIKSSTSSYSKRTVSRIDPIESASSNPGEESLARSHSIASPVPSISENRDRSSSPQLIAALPCAGSIHSYHRNEERQICVTLHSIGTSPHVNVLKIWSIKMKQLIRELDVEADLRAFVSICPGNPEIIIVCNNSTIAGWNWVEGRQILSITPVFGLSSAFFVPCSSILYIESKTSNIEIIDLDVPPGEVSPTSHTVQLYKLAASVNKDAASDRGNHCGVRFLSDNELVLLWRRITPSGRRVRKHRFFVEVARLSSIAPADDRQKVLVSERYSRGIIKHARIISKFWLPDKLQVDSSVRMLVVYEKRNIVLECPQMPSEERGIWVAQLDTGKELFTYVYPKGFTSSLYVRGNFIAIKDRESTQRRAVSLTDGREVATYDVVGSTIFQTSDTFISMTHEKSEIKFWETPKPHALRVI